MAMGPGPRGDRGYLTLKFFPESLWIPTIHLDPLAAYLAGALADKKNF